jgi:hypothetical protein
MLLLGYVYPFPKAGVLLTSTICSAPRSSPEAISSYRTYERVISDHFDVEKAYTAKLMHHENLLVL